MRKKIKKIIEIKNPIDLLLGGFTTIRNYFLHKIYKFDSWHIVSNFYLRPYKKITCQIINQKEFTNVIEFGCGLGDILSRVNCINRIGIDIDENVIKACKIINNKKIKFIKGTFFDNKFPSFFKFDREKNNLMICINWPHGYNWQSLETQIKKISCTNNINYMIIDLITNDPDNTYSNKHKIEDLYHLGDVIISKKVNGSNRSLNLIKLSKF